jgi:hypothetical protein
MQSKTKTPVLTLVALLASVATVKLWLIWNGWPENMLVADDAYYYFTIARNIAAGAGPSFDGLGSTNGFHPLWQLILVPIFSFDFSSIWTPVRLALSLSLLCDLMSAWLLWDAARKLFGSWVGIVASSGFLLAAPSFFLGMRGMEASLSCLCVCLAVFTLLELDRRRPTNFQRIAAQGLVLGFCGLARTDQLVTIGLAMAASELWRSPGPRIGIRIRDLSFVLVGAILIMLPWFLWNFFEFGSVLQVSGQVKLYASEIVGALPRDWSSLGGAVEALGHAVFSPLLVTTRWLTGEEFGPDRYWPWLSLVILAAALPLCVSGARHLDRKSRPCSAFVVSYLVVHSLLFGVLWRSYSGWYALPTVALVCLLISAAMAMAFKDRHKRWLRNRNAAFVIVLVLAQLTLYSLYSTQVQHGKGGADAHARRQLDLVFSAYQMPVRCGMWDAGLVGYVSIDYPTVTVINLDGLVNNAAFEAVKRGKYAEYLLENIDVYLQDTRRARMFLSPPELLDYLHQVEIQMSGG